MVHDPGADVTDHQKLVLSEVVLYALAVLQIVGWIVISLNN